MKIKIWISFKWSYQHLVWVNTFQTIEKGESGGGGWEEDEEEEKKVEK